MRVLLVFLIGAVFGTGIALSGMANPAKVLNFFDLAGSFDPSLAFVMAGALAVTAPGYALLFRMRERPIFDQSFHLPKSTAIDARLIGGSAVFGIGWGIAGFCPGASIPALGLGQASVAIFVSALLVGILIARRLSRSGFFANSARSA